MIGILGGGLSGVALASFLRQPCEVFEAESSLGGLCRTFEKDGFSTDIGGHILFSRDPALLDVVTAPLGENVHTRRRENRIAYGGRIIPWPFENGLGGLDREEAADCVISYLDAQSRIGDSVGASFESWALDRFGAGIARKWLIPYTEKVFKLPASELASDWVGRVPRPPVADVVRSAMGIETVGNKHQAEFRYPKVGGIEALVDGFAFGDGSLQDEHGEPLYSKGIRYHLGQRVRFVYGMPGAWVVRTPVSEFKCDELVSTIPLETLVDWCDDAPEHVKSAAHALRWNSVTTVTFGVKCDGGEHTTACYTADPSVPFHRVCFNAGFSESLAPEGHCPVTCEVTRDARDLEFSHERSALIKSCWDGLVELGAVLASDAPPVSVQDHYVKHAYPVPTLDCAANRKLVLDYLSSIGIHCLGRAGRHEYLNMDQCVAAARDLARELDK